MQYKTEQEYFELIDSLVTVRNQKIYEHFGKNFLESYLDGDQRLWYEDNLSKIDNNIVKFANDLCKLLKIKATFKKVADVFKNEAISTWYNQLKIEKNKQSNKSK